MRHKSFGLLSDAQDKCVLYNKITALSLIVIRGKKAPPQMSVSAFVGYLKGKSSLMIYEQFCDLKFKYRNREFGCRGYYVDTVGKNKAKTAEYIR